MVLRNSFRNTNLDSGSASVQIEDENAGDATNVRLGLFKNSVLRSNGADAYQLNQLDPGEFNILGQPGSTAQEVVENNNQGGPVTITGTINVIP